MALFSWNWLLGSRSWFLAIFGSAITCVLWDLVFEAAPIPNEDARMNLAVQAVRVYCVGRISIVWSISRSVQPGCVVVGQWAITMNVVSDGCTS